jgi:hypothetical protein
MACYLVQTLVSCCDSKIKLFREKGQKCEKSHDEIINERELNTQLCPSCVISKFCFWDEFSDCGDEKKSSNKGGKEFLGNKGQSYHILRKKTLMLLHLDN